MRVWNKDMWHLWPARMLDANLGWLWTEGYRGCDWPVARQSEIMYACSVLVADTLNICWCEIIACLYFMVHQNILWNCQC